MFWFGARWRNAKLLRFTLCQKDLNDETVHSSIVTLFYRHTSFFLSPESYERESMPPVNSDGIVVSNVNVYDSTICRKRLLQGCRMNPFLTKFTKTETPGLAYSFPGLNPSL
ncbi:hypothetical protein V6N13_059907 [Hibiscus sabdariffa]